VGFTAIPGDEAIDLRRELVFRPAPLRLVGRAPSLVFDGSDGGGGRPPARLHVVAAPGTNISSQRF
jgi:hypothetical protein